MQITTTPSTTLPEFRHIRDARTAAAEFEAVLVGQLLEGALSDEGFGLGGSDASAKTMQDFGRDHLARVIAKNGGLGLAALVENGLRR
jgi:Rod binding domain-containing protein